MEEHPGLTAKELDEKIGHRIHDRASRYVKSGDLWRSKDRGGSYWRYYVTAAEAVSSSTSAINVQPNSKRKKARKVNVNNVVVLPRKAQTSGDKRQEIVMPLPVRPIPLARPSSLVGDVRKAAQDYYWETGDNDLHKFVNWLSDKQSVGPLLKQSAEFLDKEGLFS